VLYLPSEDSDRGLSIKDAHRLSRCHASTGSTSRLQILPVVHDQLKALMCKPLPCLHQVPNCYLVVYMHVSGTKRYHRYVIITDVTARLNLEESHQDSFRSISAGDAIMTKLSPAAALARSSIHQLTYNFHRYNGPSLPWSLYSEPRCT